MTIEEKTHQATLFGLLESKNVGKGSVEAATPDARVVRPYQMSTVVPVQ
jgi:hypothetical protein